LTDRSKSPRKRRLQLNAEEFAPPSDMYETSEEPRLDETWVQFYGGERRGVKRLSSLDEEATPEKSVHPDDTPSQESEEAVIPSPSTVEQNTAEPSLIKALASPSPPAVPTSASSLHAHTSTVKPLRRKETLDPLSTQTPQKWAPDSSAEIREVVDTRKLTVVESDLSSVPFPHESETEPPSFDEWAKRWSPWLKRGGSIKVCEAFYQLTHARGSAECLTSNSEIMKLADLSRAQCIRNIHYLIEIGFLDKLDEVNNREAKGTYYRFNLLPTSLVDSPS